MRGRGAVGVWFQPCSLPLAGSPISLSEPNPSPFTYSTAGAAVGEEHRQSLQLRGNIPQGHPFLLPPLLLSVLPQRSLLAALCLPEAQPPTPPQDKLLRIKPRPPNLAEPPAPFFKPDKCIRDRCARPHPKVLSTVYPPSRLLQSQPRCPVPCTSIIQSPLLRARELHPQCVLRSRVNPPARVLWL